ncbi:MAG: hypothetical protein M5R36_21845 [Deltaproteobacteria bacterium]|nr:hypothetical protein [Deltaproteobacteria bacterium]
MIFDTCDAYFEDYPDRFDAEQACDESEDPWACAVECRAQYDTCDQLFQCLDEECDFPASKHKSAPDDEEGDISGGCEFCGG